MQRPDSRYLSAVTIIERGFSKNRDILLFISDLLACAGYVLDRAMELAGPGELIVGAGLFDGLIKDLLIKLLIEQIKDPAVLDRLAEALSKVIK